ncbi:Piwi-domain-containing protein [Hypoxylon crocopeplum]|nr:Piwi-domain-containing protein [Hypoxylon crocopeplum]
MSVRPSGSVRGTGTPAGSQLGSQAGSQAGSPSRRGPMKVTGTDPARDRPLLTAEQQLGKRVDLPADAFKKDTRWAARPGFNTEGKPIKIQLNIFPVIGWSDMEIYQYDINVTPNQKESGALVKKVWNTKTVTEVLRGQGGKWLYDGSKLAWSSEKIDRNETRVTVDLDSLKDKAEHQDIAKKIAQTSVFYLIIRQTKTIRLSYLKAYLQGKISWDSHVLECMNFFDHCLRQHPSEQWITIKRNFYDPMFPVNSLGNDLVINQGVYCAPRLSESINRNGSGLTINVDRCQTAFWPQDSLDQIALRIVTSQRDEWQHWDENKLSFNLRPREEVRNGRLHFIPSEPFQYLRRMTRMKFLVNHRGKLNEQKIYTIKRIVSGDEFGREGGHSRNVTFDKVEENGEKSTISVFDHYVQRWGFRLVWPQLPIVESTRGGFFPMELCNSLPHQRYNYKLNPGQTSDMIKHAATRPSKRREDIMEGVKYLEWPKDEYLRAFGIKIDPQMVVTDAKLLQNPEVAFANQKVNPGTTGRWDLRGKKFIEPNPYALKSWSFICCGDGGKTCQQNELENFARQFSQVYRNHGGKVEKPAFAKTIGFGDGDYSKICEQAYNETGRWFKEDPQIIFFVLPTKNQLTYERIKKNMDCRFNIVSQCLQAGQVKKCQGQYLSNVAMKVNSKLGGSTCRVAAPNMTVPPFWKQPTMIIGVDVSHGGAGSSQPSMAALTMSMDRYASKYAGACETNGYRTETIQKNSMKSMLPKLVKHWIQVNGAYPKHIYYLRDGVSEGQFQDVLDKEVSEMRRIFQESGSGSPKFTVVIATKRHHVRFFPKANDKFSADRNGNPLPGTVVEKDVTHPQHFDFYLCSHAAIQGTARPVHYQVILDEQGVKPNEFMKMIYQHCYQYCRSTTPVSLHPAVYYSHLASNRARSHENVAAQQKLLGYGKDGNAYGKTNSEIYDEKEDVAPPLMPMLGPGIKADAIRFINTTMWYV